ncbi:pyocin knob domain-containing protein [Paenibacillus senegalensis]|uniref:pyocin knob domain-containing protein n=1 Tax=Paenibacillus senegalensis TaxID=1465766 RepID=UPI0002883A14|nr:pyocin knob domain-containing protein [Paenibacillus senegalensis]
MTYQGRTDWQYNDIVTEDDLNRIEQGIQEVSEQISSTGQDVADHISDSTRHITADERTSWNAAQQNAINWAKSYGLGSSAPVISDLNNIPITSGTGFYTTTGSTANTPPGINANGAVIHIARDHRPSQIYINYSSNRMFVRGYDGTSWNNWSEVWTASSFNPSGKVNIAGDVMAGNLTIDKSRPLLFFRDRNDSNTALNGVVHQSSNGTSLYSIGVSTANDTWNIYDHTAGTTALQIRPGSGPNDFRYRGGEVWHAGNFDPNSKAGFSGAKVLANGSWAGIRANATGNTNPEIDLYHEGVRRGLINAEAGSVQIRKYSADGLNIESRFHLTSSGATLNGNELWHNGNNTASLSTTGYQRLASGLIIQWGDVVATRGATITFPISFPSSVYQVAATLNQADVEPIGITGLGRTGFTVNHNNNSTIGRHIRYIAIGR